MNSVSSAENCCFKERVNFVFWILQEAIDLELVKTLIVVEH